MYRSSGLLQKPIAWIEQATYGVQIRYSTSWTKSAYYSPFTSLVLNSRASTIIPETFPKDFVKLCSFTFTLSTLYGIKLWILTFNAWTLCFELYSALSGFSIKSRVQIKLCPVLSQLSYSGFRQKAGSNCRHHGICFIISILAEWCQISLLFCMRLYLAKVSWIVV